MERERNSSSCVYVLETSSHKEISCRGTVEGEVIFQKDAALPKFIISLIKPLIKLILFFDALVAVAVIVANASWMNRCV